MTVSDLLSTLVVILARQNLQSAEIDSSYMWGLIDHSFLVGDSTYFLMTFSSAVDRLKAVRKSIENMSLGHRSVSISHGKQNYRPRLSLVFTVLHCIYAAIWRFNKLIDRLIY